ncbi:type II toxin-antitoxin system Rv0910 family toxin [Nocardia thailandica]|uniref:SRPBCC family protein n=1 Tax=Nocardia thailandica TaxID=257275 RepID=A0ABW6PN35_9NOCA|nr:SRPBCC family protein [Nocardia thailandica]
MAKLKLSVDVPLPPEKTWEHASNLSELGTWLTIHDGWRSELPTELTPGTVVVGVAKVKGMRNRVTWTIKRSNPPAEMLLSGAGIGGTKIGLGLQVKPKGPGSEVVLDVDLGGAPLFGPIGSAVAKAIRGDVERSLDQFVARYA